MRRLFLVAIAVSSLQGIARGGALEILENSPAGVAMAGAQTAVATDPAAIFYNPAGMTLQRGWGGMASLIIVNANAAATSLTPGQAKAESHTNDYIPALYGVQRVGSHFAIGLGSFVQFGQDLKYPDNAPGRFQGNFLNIQTVTFNPSLAIRPAPWISIGFGVDFMPSSFEIKKSLNFGGGEGKIDASGGGLGIGGNAGLMLRIVPQYLTFGFSYRSAMQVDYTGKASLDVPPELASLAASLQNAKTSITFPHNFSIALASKPLRGLTIDVDVHVTMWSSFNNLKLTLTDPNNKSAPPTVQAMALNWSDSYGVRVGMEYRAWDQQLILRLGGGYDRTPVPQSTMSPLSPDADRGLIGGGIGFTAHRASDWFTIEASYLATILVSRQSHLADFPARYDSIGHVFSIGITLRADTFPSRINNPDYKN